MRPSDLDTLVHRIRKERNTLLESGLHNAENLAPMICSMLEALLQHEADKECRSIAAGGRPTR